MVTDVVQQERSNNKCYASAFRYIYIYIDELFIPFLTPIRPQYCGPIEIQLTINFKLFKKNCCKYVSYQ